MGRVIVGRVIVGRVNGNHMIYLSYYLIKTDGFSTKILQTCLKVVTEPDFWFKSLFAYRMVNGIKDCHIYSVPI